MEIEAECLIEHKQGFIQSSSQQQKPEDPSGESPHCGSIKSENRASEIQEGDAKSCTPKHKLIKKILKARNKNAKAKNKNNSINNKKLSDTTDQTNNQQALNVHQSSTSNTTSSIYPSPGYTFFTQQIDKYYLPTPTHQHFQTVDNLLTVSDLSTNSLLNTLPSHQSHTNHKLQSLQEYLHLIQNTRRNDNEVQVLFRNQCEESVLGFYSVNHINVNNQDKVQLKVQDEVTIQQSDLRFLCTRDAFMKTLTQKQLQYNNNKSKQKYLSEISRQLLFLNQYLKKKSESNKTLLEELKHSLKLQKDLLPPPRIEPIEDSLCKLMLQKNISMAFNFIEIDVMNYFKMKACQEEKKDFIAIQNQKKMIQYIKKKRLTKNKKPKNPLYTSCTACLSGYHQQTNPLTYCHDCYYRIHRNCRLFLDKDECCRLCTSKRQRAKKKDFVECILCPVQGLTYMEIGNKNIHAFCILVSNNYSIENQSIKVTPELMQGSDTSSPCLICSKMSNKLYKCSDIEESVHPACAFFAGYQMSFTDKKLNISYSSFTQEERIRNQFYRKYKLNYGGIAFKCYSFQQYKKHMNSNTPSSKDNHSSSQKEEERQSWESEEVQVFVEQQVFEQQS